MDLHAMTVIKESLAGPEWEWRTAADDSPPELYGLVGDDPPQSR